MLVLGTGVTPNNCQGQTIQGVRAYDVSSELVGGGNAFDRRVLYTLDGSGFVPDTSAPAGELKGFHTTFAEVEGTPGTFWSTNGTFGFAVGAQNDLLPSFVVFDLNAVYDLDSFTVWNGNEVTLDAIDLTNRGAQSVNISLGTNPEALVPIGNYVFDRAPGADDVSYGQTFDLSGVATASATRYVRFDFLSNYEQPGDPGNSDMISIAEIRFTGVGIPPIPGDANRDGQVDLADLTILHSNLLPGIPTSPLPSTYASWDDGDFDGDAMVTLADYRIWKGAFEAQSGQLVGTNHVPEPASAAVLCLAMGVALRLWQRRSAG